MLLVLALPALALSQLREPAPEGPPASRAPALANLIARSGSPLRESEGTAAALASLYGVQRQQDWPLAAIRVASLGIDPGADYWLAADPVTLNVGQDDVRLGGIVDDLERADADALIVTLNTHFASDGLIFVAPRPDAFFVHLRTTPQLDTHPPVASGRSLRTLLPEGADAPTWRRWQSEIQMLLHEHDVNVLRERAGRPPANSVWFSHGGRLPASPPTVSIRTFASSGVAVALAAHAGTPARAVPDRLDAVIDGAGGADIAVVVLEPGVDLRTVESAWLAPAKRALDAGKLSAVSLIADADGAAAIWQAVPQGLWQRLTGLRRRRDLSALLGASENAQ